MLLRVFRTTAIVIFAFLFLQHASVLASEADLKIPDLQTVNFDVRGATVHGLTLLYAGLGVCVLAMLFGWMQYKQTKALDVHSSMQNVSNLIWETCKTYLFQQGKFLVILWVLIAACMAYYFKVLQ